MIWSHESCIADMSVLFRAIGQLRLATLKHEQ